MKKFLVFILGIIIYATPSGAWFDETHVAIAKAAGYYKWFNAVDPDMIKEKMGNREWHYHFAINPRETLITDEKVIAQADKNNKIDSHGHPWGSTRIR